MKKSGTIVVDLKSERYVGAADAPCQGYMRYVEHRSSHATRTPDVFDLIERALWRHPEFGSEVRLVVYIEVVKEARPSTKTCHNPWPAHTCRTEAGDNR